MSREKNTEIKLSIVNSAKISTVSRIGIAVIRASDTNERIMAYMLSNLMGGMYHAGKGSRKDACKRLKISPTVYNRSIEYLRKNGLIVKINNANGSRYCFYKPNGIFGRLLKQIK